MRMAARWKNAFAFLREIVQAVRRKIGDAWFFLDYRWHFWGRMWRTPLVGAPNMLLMNWLIFKTKPKATARNKFVIFPIAGTGSPPKPPRAC
jgi:hypothetical protein